MVCSYAQMFLKIVSSNDLSLLKLISVHLTSLNQTAAVKRRSPGHVKCSSHAKSWRFPGSPHIARQLAGLVAAHCLEANRCQCILNYRNS